jgi:hypothetical protein
LNSNPGHVGCVPLYLVSCGESSLLVSWYTGSMCYMEGCDEDRGRSRRPGAENHGWSSTGRVLGGRAIGRSGDVVCVEHRFLG